jgi:hemerythrin-like domain-containing protein
VVVDDRPGRTGGGGPDQEGTVSLTSILADEHRIIERLLTALDEAAAKIERGQTVRTGFFLDAAEFIRGFADGCHHRKEEGILFPAMMGHGFPMTSGPLAVMLAEHEQARGHARAMREAAEAHGRGDRTAGDLMAASARAYATLLRQHITKEERALFPMAESAITAAKHAPLAAELEQSARDTKAAERKYVDLVDALRSEMSN